MTKDEKFESFKALACLIEQSARVDPDPKVGQLYPKSHRHLTRFTSKEESKT